MNKEIQQAIDDDLPSIYQDDIKNWDNLVEVIKDMVLNQINNIINFQYRNFPKKYPELKTYDANKIKWLGYKNSNKSMLIEIYLSYDTTASFTIRFNKYKATRAEVVDAINQKINSKLSINQFSEAKTKNWENLDESIAVGRKYQIKILNILKDGIEVKEQKILINKNRFKHSGVSVVNSELLLSYNYLLLNQWVSLKVTLKNSQEIKKIITTIVDRAIKEFISNKEGISISGISNWKDLQEKINQGINPVIKTITEIKDKVLTFAHLLDGIIPFDTTILNNVLTFSKVPNIGPLDNSFVINLRLFNGETNIPLKFNFNNPIEENMIGKIQPLLLKKTQDLYLSKSILTLALPNKAELIQNELIKAIGNEINVDDEKIFLTAKKFHIDNDIESLINTKVAILSYENITKQKFEIPINFLD